MARFRCPYLNGEVELSEERERHIAVRHPELLPEHRGTLENTLAEPDEVRRDADYPNTRLFIRWFEHLLGGKNVVVAVVSAEVPEVRRWIVTAFATGRPPKGEIEWKRP